MANEENGSAPTGTNVVSKTQELIDAARRRNEVVNEKDQDDANSKDRENRANKERVEGLVEATAPIADLNVQARAKTLAGEIDPRAMGDVKGDGRDAKDYPDSDPAKALGVTTAEHGLNSSEGSELAQETTFGHRVSRRTQMEMSKGRENLGAAKTERERNLGSHLTTAVTDANDDPDGSVGDAEAAERRRLAEESNTTDVTKTGDSASEGPGDGSSSDPDGSAPADTPLDDMTKAQLVAYAKGKGVELDASKTRPVLLEEAKAIQS